MAFRPLLLLPVLILAACSPQGDGRRTPSGLPVPRYVSLKFDEVNARQGPAEDNRLMWTYHAKGLPVLVIAETTDWRRICDPTGAVAWVHKRGTSGVRTTLNQSTETLTLYEKPRADSAPRAYLRGRSTAELEACEGGWCRLRSGDREGWTSDKTLWGIAEPPQCR